MLVFAALTLVAAPIIERPDPHPDIPVGNVITAYVGPRFVTGESFVPEARTVLVDETGRVRALLNGPPPKDAHVVTLPGKLAVAGLHDAHVHLEGIGRLHEGVELLGALSVKEAVARVKAWATAHPQATVVEGRGWDQSRYAHGAWPTARELEGAVSSSQPAVLERVDGHAIWVNQRALTLAGITRDTPDPAGGKIIRDSAGAPSGVLIDNAMDLVRKKLPQPSASDTERWLVAGMKACADAGLVAVHDMGMPVTSAQILKRLDDAHALPLRVFVYLDGTQEASYAYLDEVPAANAEPSSTARLRVMGVKLYADGAMGSRGAALLDDYSDDKGNRGLLVTDEKTLNERVARVHKKGFGVAVHAIGDRANRIVLDAMRASSLPADVPGKINARDRIEHAQ
ncbi:MAG TPA: amidohydrolase family protein, partial [Myxococcota bacterium]